MRNITDLVRHLPDDALTRLEREARAERLRRLKVHGVVDMEDARIERLRGPALDAYLAAMKPHELGGTA